MDTILRVSIAQYNIAWEDKQANLAYIKRVMQEISGKTDILVLPEMCTTGFTMNSKVLAEPMNGNTITCFKKWSEQYNIALCGSFIACEGNRFFNRAFFISEHEEHYYDKRHLFRMGAESEHFASGNKRLIFEHKGFHICLLICYDLRFPVWARNVINEYDLLIYVANWPTSRANVWNTLLPARAIENMSYVCGVNRIGKDGNNWLYEGDSKVIDAKGYEILSTTLNQEQIKTVYLSKKDLDSFRDKFPVWKDADKFEFK